VAGMGWSSAQFKAWLEATGLPAYLGDADIYHEPPQAYLDDALIPDSLRNRLTRAQRSKLRSELKEYLLTLPVSFSEWDRFRAQVTDILSKYQTKGIRLADAFTTGAPLAHPRSVAGRYLAFYEGPGLTINCAAVTTSGHISSFAPTRPDDLPLRMRVNG
jgi:hypothetical protein